MQSHIQIYLSLIVCARHDRFPANKHVHETNPLHNTTNKILIKQYFKIYGISTTLLFKNIKQTFDFYKRSRD